MTNTLPYRYSPPVDRLLNYGDCLKMREWPNYLELGLTTEHVPELVRMATDDDLHFADTNSLEVWAPVHAWRALGQLRAEAAIEPLVALLARIDENEDDDWTPGELPRVFAEIGPTAIPELAAFLADEQRGVYGRTAAANGLQHIAEQHPAARDEVVAILMRQLEQFDDQEENFNAFLISSLADLKATEALPLIERAFAAKTVEESIVGDWEDIQIEFGLKAERETPRPNFFLENFPSEEEFLEVVTDEIKRLSLLDRKNAKKEKAKRKQAKKARKKNRKK